MLTWLEYRYAELPVFTDEKAKQEYLLSLYSAFRAELESLEMDGKSTAPLYAQYNAIVDAIYLSPTAQGRLLMTQGEYYFFVTAAAVCAFVVGMGLAQAMWGGLCQ
jgi:hypothetical protein